MLCYTVHMSSIQAKYFNRDEEGKSGTKMRCGVQVGGSSGRALPQTSGKNAVCFTYAWVWSLKEVLLFRVPPWPQHQGR